MFYFSFTLWRLRPGPAFMVQATVLRPGLLAALARLVVITKPWILKCLQYTFSSTSNIAGVDKTLKTINIAFLDD